MKIPVHIVHRSNIATRMSWESNDGKWLKRIFAAENGEESKNQKYFKSNRQSCRFHSSFNSGNFLSFASSVLFCCTAPFLILRFLFVLSLQPNSFTFLCHLCLVLIVSRLVVGPGIATVVNVFRSRSFFWAPLCFFSTQANRLWILNYC